MESISNTQVENKNENENEDEDENKYPEKKYLDEEDDKNDLEDYITITTNLSKVTLNENAIKGVYLYGCDIEEQTKIVSDFNPVNIMRKARKLKCFQTKIKEYVPDYYISGLILMGRPIKDTKENKKFKFYLFLKTTDGIDGKILTELPEEEPEGGKIYKFKFKRKKKDLLEMKQGDKPGESECVANYLNICLGKILKKCGYTKDRSSRKILYYNKKDAKNAQFIEKSNFLFFPALKAVCES